MWCSNRPEVEQYLRNIFPEAIEYEVISQPFWTKVAARADKWTLTKREWKSKWFWRRKRKIFWYLRWNWGSKAVECTLSVPHVTWSYVELMIRCSVVIEDWQSLRKCSRTVKKLYIYYWFCLHLYTILVRKNTPAVLSYYDFGVHA